MMKANFRFLKLSVLIGILSVIIISVNASVPYKLDTKSSTMQITGTSTLHDWEMDIEGVTGTLNFQDENAIDKPVSGNLSINVNSIKSEENLMNKKTYEALKESSYPKIEVKLIQVDNEKAQVELKIAGVTKVVTDDFQLKNLGSGKLSVSGILDLKMTDFKVEPPVMMLGALKTGDAIKVKYNLVFQK